MKNSAVIIPKTVFSAKFLSKSQNFIDNSFRHRETNITRTSFSDKKEEKPT